MSKTDTLELDDAGDPFVSETPVLPLSTAVAEFNPIAAGIAQLRHELQGRAYDLTTVKGNDEARRDRKRLVTLRMSIDRLRLDLNRDDRAEIEARIGLRNREAARLTEIIVALETPIDLQIKADEKRREEERARKAEAEAARVAGIRERIEQIAAVARRALGKPSAEIEAKIALVVAQPIDQATFAEFAPEAATVKDDTLTQLRDLLAATQQAEQQAAELARQRAELERLQAEQRRRDEEAAAEARRQRERREAEEAAERERIAAEQRAEAERLARQRAEMEAERALIEKQREQLIAAERRAEEEAAEKLRAAAEAAQAREAAERRRIEEEAAAARQREQEAEQRATHAAPRMLDMLRALVSHWHEFGAGDGFEEQIDRAARLIAEVEGVAA